MQKKLTVLFTFAIFVLIVGWAIIPAHADCPHRNRFDHRHCRDEPPPVPVGPVVASVENQLSSHAVQQITKAMPGTYITISPKNFNKRSALKLRQQADVLFFPWSGPSSIRANWDKLVAFMVAGGSIIFEDSQNIADLSQINTTFVENHTTEDDPDIIFDTTRATGVLSRDFDANRLYRFDNIHIKFFDEQQGDGTVELHPFLRMDNHTGEVVGLYGQHAMGGRIVITGTDDGFHANPGVATPPARVNHHQLLCNKIHWAAKMPLETECPEPLPGP